MTPIFAGITDKIGRRTEIFFITSVFIVLTFVLWIFMPTCPHGGCYSYYIPILFNGFGTAMFSAVAYPAVPLTVD